MYALCCRKGCNCHRPSSKKKRNIQKPLEFERKSLKERQLQILNWFVSKENSEAAVKNDLILTKVNVKANPAEIPTCCLDENVNLQGIRRYFSPDGGEALQHVYQDSNPY